MKKIYFLFCAICIGTSLFAQTVPGGDMENWRTTTAGGGPGHTAVTVQAPIGWYGVDSLFIGLGQSLGSVILMTQDSDWHRQLFQESTVVHGGTYSAKLITAYQDSILFPGILSNAKTHVNITFTAPYITGVTYTSGMPVPAGTRPVTVSAWVQYAAGKDTLGVPGSDTALLTVQALSEIHGIDSAIGIGLVRIPPCTWTQVTANINYPVEDSLLVIDTMRITFTSSASRIPLDSSTLYVDDVTMTSIPQVSHVSVKSIATGNDPVKIYPNPATGVLFLDGPQNAGLNCRLFSVNGRTVATKILTGNDTIDISSLPGELYFYAIYDQSGTAIQRGKVTVGR